MNLALDILLQIKNLRIRYHKCEMLKFVQLFNVDLRAENKKVLVRPRGNWAFVATLSYSFSWPLIEFNEKLLSWLHLSCYGTWDLMVSLTKDVSRANDKLTSQRMTWERERKREREREAKWRSGATTISRAPLFYMPFRQQNLTQSIRDYHLCKFYTVRSGACGIGTNNLQNWRWTVCHLSL